jgi:hypothetical protein
MTEQPRVVSWFSCGANSAVATKLAIKKYGLERMEIVYCDTGGEHPDNKRFLKDCEKWFGKEVTVLRNDKYVDHMDVWEKKKFIKAINGAKCTIELKKTLRHRYQRVDDIQIMGYSYDEKHRADRFNEHFPEVYTDFILIEQGLHKSDCQGLMTTVGIEIPTMYKLGFNNNNCIGCCKGGKGYWNLVRRHFPEHFERASKLERQLGHSMNEIYLDELPLGEGTYKEIVPSCDFICQTLDIDLA